MGLSAWNAYRARQAELEQTLTPNNTAEAKEPEKEQISTSPVADGVEVEKPAVIEEEVKPKKKRAAK